MIVRIAPPKKGSPRWTGPKPWALALLLGSWPLAPLSAQEFTVQEFDFTAPSGIPINAESPGTLSPDPAAAPIAPPLPMAPPAGATSELPLPPSLPTYSLDQQPIAPADPALGMQSPSVVPMGRPPEETAYTYIRPSGLTPSQPQTAVERGELPRGSALPLTVYREIIFPPFQAINGQLEIASPVTDRYGQVVIPAGSVVWGTFEPVYEERNTTRETGEDPSWNRRVIGSRFIANRLTINQATYMVQGQSDFLPTGFDPQADLGTTAIRGAGYGAAGGLALGLLTGGVGFIPMVAGSLAGAAAGTTNIDRVITLRPNFVLSVELTDDLILQ